MVETTRTPVFSRYQLFGKLGSGGMGSVYKARDTHLERWVALKVLPPALQEEPDVLERFKREARALARVKHPGIAAVYDANVERGFPHLVMELVEGENLEQVLRGRGRLSIAEVLRLGVELAEALDHVHHHRIVHRDVKTANIILSDEGRVVLTDFGIAFSASLPRLSQGALGTPEYMSPEQAAGQPLDGRSDLYSLGVVLFECLTGTVPFSRTNESFVSLTQLMTEVMDQPAPSVAERRPDTPAFLVDIIARTLAKQPERRFASGAELAMALRVGDAAEVTDDASVPRTPDVDDRAEQPTAVIETAPAGNSVLLGHTQPVDAIAFSPDSRRLATASEDGSVRIWDLKSGRIAFTLGGHRGNVVSVAYSPDGVYVASGDVTGRVRLWYAETGRLLHEIEAHDALVMAVAFSPDSKYLASGGSDRAVRLWRVKKGTQARTLGWHTAYVLSASFHPDGGRLVSGGADGDVHVWDVRHGRLLQTLQGHTSWVISVAYSPDGRAIASGGMDDRVMVWDASNGRIVHTLKRHKACVTSVAFSPSSRFLVTAGRDRAIHVWDARSGRVARTLKGHTGPVSAVAVSPDGAYLASGSIDQTARVWPLQKRSFARRRWGRWGVLLALALAIVAGFYWNVDVEAFVRPATAQMEDLFSEWFTTPARPAAPGEDGAGVPSAQQRIEAERRAERQHEQRRRDAILAAPLRSRGSIAPRLGGYTLVVAVKATSLEAERVARWYHNQGLRTGVIPVVFEGRRQYRVGVGQFGLRSEASRFRRQLSGHGRELPHTTWVMALPGE